MLFTFGMALLIVFLVLAAQFESFMHPLVIMLTVPLAVLGALLGLWLTGNTLNLFSQIGIVMLVGLAAKNGILIVEFANQLRDEGLAMREAIARSGGHAPAADPDDLDRDRHRRAAADARQRRRARPAAARSASWWCSAWLLSTLLSLFVVPAFYLLLAPLHARAGRARRACWRSWTPRSPSVDSSHGG